MALRRNSQITRCPVCMVHADNCYCSKIKKLSLKTKVSFIMYKKERFLPSNTANLALNSLNNSKVFYRGIKDTPLPAQFIEHETHHALYLYPDDDAEVLNQDMFKDITKPINLIIPDGTWRQAKKIYVREKALEGVQKVKLPPVPKSTYLLRRQKFENGVCTFEAMAFALKFLEGQNCEEILFKNFELMMQAHLKNRMILEKQKKRPFY